MIKGIKVIKDLRESKVGRDKTVLKAIKVKKVIKAIKEIKVKKEIKGIKVTLEKLVRRDFKGRQVHRDQPGRVEGQVFKDLKDPVVHLDKKETKVTKVMMVHKGTPDSLVLQDLEGLEVLMDLLVLRELKA